VGVQQAAPDREQRRVHEIVAAAISLFNDNACCAGHVKPGGVRELTGIDADDAVT